MDIIGSTSNFVSLGSSSVRVHVLEKAEKVKTAAELVTEAATLA